MSHLVSEIMLRLAKAAAAALIGLVLYALLVGALGVNGTAELALLCWLAGAAFILVVETSPI